ncbi:MAG: hypothetical protein SNJ57_14175 [Cyanobacteriota bacterium]
MWMEKAIALNWPLQNDGLLATLGDRPKTTLVRLRGLASRLAAG